MHCLCTGILLQSSDSSDLENLDMHLKAQLLCRNVAYKERVNVFIIFLLLISHYENGAEVANTLN